MKYLITSSLILLSFVGISQYEIEGTGWKFEGDDGKQNIVLFEVDGTFYYQRKLDIMSKRFKDKSVIYDNFGGNTWEINEKSITMLFNDGGLIYSGEVDDDYETITGTYMNRGGQYGTFKGELIKFD